MKVMTVVGTRPEIIRLSRTVELLERTTEHVFVHTRQNHDPQLSEVFLRELGLPEPDHHLAVATGRFATTLANVVTQVDDILELEQPDALLLLGDTNSALCVIPAKRRKIPVFHMEAGNRCFDDRVPEEINRRLIDHLSDVNLPYTEHGRRNLLAEGLPADRIFTTGSPQREVVEHHRDRILASDVLRRLGLEREGYLVASIHREENVDDEARLAQVADSLAVLGATFDRPIVLSTHPRTADRLRRSATELVAHVLVHEPFGFADYLRLQTDAFCTVSDSGTVTEESAILGFPAVTMRHTHERPEGMDHGVLVMSGLGAERAVEAVRLARVRYERFGPPTLPDAYAPLDVSARVVNIVQSYTDDVRRRVWGVG